MSDPPGRPPLRSDPRCTVVWTRSVCVCGHLADHHADPAIGDSACCLVVEDRRDLLDVFDDRRATLPGRGPSIER